MARKLSKQVATKNKRRAKPLEGYVVAFYMNPEVGLKEPLILAHTLRETFSRTPEMAKKRWLDDVHEGDKPKTWNKYNRCGQRIRKVKIIDMGDA